MADARTLEQLRHRRAYLTERVNRLDEEMIAGWKAQENPFKAWAWWVSPTNIKKRTSVVKEWAEVGERIVELVEDAAATRRRMGVRRKELVL